MEITDIRSAVTVVSFVAFLSIVVWAWSRRNKDDFEEAGRLPFDDEAP